MAHVTVTIAGRAYRMACGDGEEDHLKSLGEVVDAKIAELKGAFGEIGDQRITVMASLTFADELSEARTRIAVLEAECDRLRQDNDAHAARGGERDDLFAQSLARAAQRIEEVSHSLGSREGAPRDGSREPANVASRDGGGTPD